MESDEADHEEDGAARAFAELRAEVTILRRAVEALEAPDYGPSLGAISQGLGEIEERLSGIEAHLALTLTPEQHARAIERAGADIMREASNALRDETAAVKRERQQLAALVGQAVTQEAQRRQQLWFGAGGLALGSVLFPLLAAFAPGGTFLTALTMRTTNRWQAGAALLQAADPAGSAALATVTRFYNANNEALQTCAEAARKAGKEQRCTVSVAVPER